MQNSEHESLVSRILRPLRLLTTTFKAWSEGNASQTQVSDCYVTLCQEFNAVKSIFAQAGMQVNDLVDVPQRLRKILEEALSFQKSPTVYKKYEPHIRAVMAELFTQLKERKDVKVISHHYRERSRSSATLSEHAGFQSPQQQPSRNSMHVLGPPMGPSMNTSMNMNVASPGASGGIQSGIQTSSTPGTPRSSVHGSQLYAQLGQLGVNTNNGATGGNNNGNSLGIQSPSRTFHNIGSTSSVNYLGQPMSIGSPVPSSLGSRNVQSPMSPSLRQGHTRTGSLPAPMSPSIISPPNNGSHVRSPSGTPSGTPGGFRPTHNTSYSMGSMTPQSPMFNSSTNKLAPDVTSPNYKPSSSAMSQYRSPSAVPRIRNSPFQDTMQTEDPLLQLQKQKALERQASRRYSIRQVSKAANGSPDVSYVPTTVLHRRSFVPDFQETNVVHGTARRNMSNTPSQLSATYSSNNNGASMTNLSKVGGNADVTPATPAQSERRQSMVSLSRSPRVDRPQSQPMPTTHPEVHVPSHVPSDTIHVFLKLGNIIRKAELSKPPSIAAIRFQFLEVCSYMHSENETFPVIELLDGATGIQYEVTEATVGDVTDGSLLSLKVKSSEEQNMESEMSQLKEMMKEVIKKIESKPEPRGVQSHSSIPETPRSGNYMSPIVGNDGTFTLEKPLQRKISSKATVSTPTQDHQQQQHPESRTRSSSLNGDGTMDIPKEQLEKDLVVLRQFCNKTVGLLRDEVMKLKNEIKSLNTNVPIGDRSFIGEARSTIDQETQELLARMDDLSDIIDFQRVSVGSNGVRFPTHELEKVRRELNSWAESFAKSEKFLQNERPVWKKIWQSELNTVIQEQDWLKQIDELYTALHSDLTQTLNTFNLVCEANSIQRPHATRAPLLRPPVKPGEEKDISNAVLREIEGLNLDSEKREEAAKRAERLHKAKLALRSEEFVDELNSFVTDSKLKPNGGHEEVERRRMEREEETRRLAEECEREVMQLNETLKKEKKAERAAARAANRESNNSNNDNGNTNASSEPLKDPENAEDDDDKSDYENNDV